MKKIAIIGGGAAGLAAAIAAGNELARLGAANECDQSTASVPTVTSDGRIFVAFLNGPTPGTTFSYLTLLPVGSWIWLKAMVAPLLVAEKISTGIDDTPRIGGVGRRTSVGTAGLLGPEVHP